ncbi:MAG: hypothetical protein M0Q91_04675 [Methanoregula sp.]|jgi:hypothetical protein|nr:hypothetical protein [Methanoregula sp.]
MSSSSQTKSWDFVISPSPPFVLRELWLRTQHERVWRRLIVHDLSVGEIGWWGPDDYTNPHAR